jgi:tRNA threonylcarbamoyladenosine biosynthesis protein TsaB
MIALGIETSGRGGSVALGDGAGMLHMQKFGPGARHAREIMSLVDALFTDAGLTRGDIGLVAVVQGPGAFTGLRIGVTCAKTLAWALGWRIAGVSTLEVQAQSIPPEPGAVICPVHDARRGRVYACVFDSDGAVWRDRTGVISDEPDAVAARIPEGALVYGSGVAAWPDVFRAPRFCVGDEEAALSIHAGQVLTLGLRRAEAEDLDDPMTLVPRYYRRTAAEEQYGKG